MIIGVPRERKDHEFRVALTPAGASALVRSGHNVLVERGAGEGSGFVDDDYRRAGASTVTDAEEVWAAADLITKVKEPVGGELNWLRPGLVLFTYLHLAANQRLTTRLAESYTTAVAYEMVEDARGRLPLLAPMSEVAGRLAPQVAAHALEYASGGAGVLMGGVTGVAPARVAILGAGNVGTNAARVARGMGAEVTVVDRELDRLQSVGELLGVKTLCATNAAELGKQS